MDRVSSAAERLLILAVCFSARINETFDYLSRERRLSRCDPYRRASIVAHATGRLPHTLPVRLKHTAKIKSRSAAGRIQLVIFGGKNSIDHFRRGESN